MNIWLPIVKTREYNGVEIHTTEYAVHNKIKAMHDSLEDRKNGKNNYDGVLLFIDEFKLI